MESVTTTRGKLVVGLLDNVTGGALVYSHGPKGWTSQKLALPATSTIGLGSASQKDDRLFVSVTGYLTPSTYWLADAASLKLEQVKASPARFDASTHVVEQFEATSSDGVKIPYFVVRPKGVTYDGTAPTLLYAYGGFQVSMTPAYSGVMGKLWLERGGTYVVANIRGGGEFGPAWHNAGLKENRQKVYDDFFAVSQDLITRKITSPRRLGIMGGSNGGLLMGVALTQRPELYNAIVVQVPLFDMIRYTQIGAGDLVEGRVRRPGHPVRAGGDRHVRPLFQPQGRPEISRGVHRDLDQGRPRPPGPRPQGGRAAGGTGLSGAVLREHRRRPRGQRQPGRDRPPPGAGICLSVPQADGLRMAAGPDNSATGRRVRAVNPSSIYPDQYPLDFRPPSRPWAGPRFVLKIDVFPALELPDGGPRGLVGRPGAPWRASTVRSCRRCGPRPWPGRAARPTA